MRTWPIMVLMGLLMVGCASKETPPTATGSAQPNVKPSVVSGGKKPVVIPPLVPPPPR